MFFGGPNGQTLTMDDFHARLSSMETKIDHLQSEIKTLKSQNKEQDLETKIELKEVQADVSFILMEQVKMSDRIQDLEADKTTTVETTVSEVLSGSTRSQSPLQIQMQVSGTISIVRVSEFNHNPDFNLKVWPICLKPNIELRYHKQFQLDQTT